MSVTLTFSALTPSAQIRRKIKAHAVQTNTSLVRALDLGMHRDPAQGLVRKVELKLTRKGNTGLDRYRAA